MNFSNLFKYAYGSVNIDDIALRNWPTHRIIQNRSVIDEMSLTQHVTGAVRTEFVTHRSRNILANYLEFEISVFDKIGLEAGR